MKNIKIQAKVSAEDLRDIKRFYGVDDIKTVEAVVSHILDRYLNVEYFDPKLIIEG